MNLTDLAVATITWARSPDEEPLLIRSLERLIRTGIPVVVADRGTNDQFLRELGKLACAVEVARRQTLTAQVQQSVARAAGIGRRFICYVEPDKEQFFENDLLEFLARVPDDDDDDLGVVLAARSRESFLTFPPMQQYAERVVNDVCGAALGVEGDYSYGPFVMHRALASDLEHLPEEIGWGWRPATFATAHRRGRRIVHVVGDYACPPEQRTEGGPDRLDRIRQLSQNLQGLLAGLDRQPPHLQAESV